MNYAALDGLILDEADLPPLGSPGCVVCGQPLPPKRGVKGSKKFCSRAHQVLYHEWRRDAKESGHGG